MGFFPEKNRTLSFMSRNCPYEQPKAMQETRLEKQHQFCTTVLEAMPQHLKLPALKSYPNPHATSLLEGLSRSLLSERDGRGGSRKRDSPEAVCSSGHGAIPWILCL